MAQIQVWLPFVTAPQALVPGSCTAARTWARVRFGSGGVRVPSVPVETHEARQLAYQRHREEWRAGIEAVNRRSAKTPLEGHTGTGGFFR